MPRDPIFDRLWNHSVGFYTVWVVHLGNRFGLLPGLVKRRLTAKELARSTKLSGPTVALWCDAAHSLGFLRRAAGGRFALDRRLVPYLVDHEDLRYLGGQYSYLALRSLDFDGFDDLFRRGRPSGLVTRHLVEAIHEATKWDHNVFLKLALPKVPALRRRLEAGAHVVDIGCGSGEWIRTMAARFLNSSFIGIEPSADALRIARRQARDLGRRVTFRRVRGEDFLPKPGAALVYLGEALYAADSKETVLDNARRALADDGWLVVLEGLVDPEGDPSAPGNQVLNPMRLDFALQGASFFTRRELQRLVEDAGFDRFRWFDAGGNVWVLVARKPAPNQRPSRRVFSRTPTGSRSRRG